MNREELVFFGEKWRWFLKDGATYHDSFLSDLQHLASQRQPWTCATCGGQGGHGENCPGDLASQRQEHEACPCLHVEPCDPLCTCIRPYSSRGCERCCSYGSKEQRVVAATRLVAQAAAQGEGWRQIAEQESRNRDYYRSLVVEIGELFGVAARTADDGGIAEDVLCAKVPELVRAQAALVARLGAYALHKLTCPTMRKLEPCDCGLDALLAELAPTTPTP